MARDLLQELAPRTPYSEEELVDFVVDNRNMSLAKMSQTLHLGVGEVRRLLASSDFRKKASERLTLEVVDLKTETKILEQIAMDALATDTKPQDRVRSADFLLNQGGVARARETKVDVDHSVRVVFEPLRRLEGGWEPPDHLAGVVGAPSLPAPSTRALPSGVEELDAELAEEASEWGEEDPA